MYASRNYARQLIVMSSSEEEGNHVDLYVYHEDSVAFYVQERRQLKLWV